MSRIVLDFDLLPGITESLTGSLEVVLKKLGNTLPRKLQAPDDPELCAIWEEDLREAFRSDATLLLRILHDSDFGKSGYSLEDVQVESLVRACSGLRLALRDAVLGKFSDAELEAGATHPAYFPPEEREGVLGFWFLGALQELLVRALDAHYGFSGDSLDGELFDPDDPHSI